MKVWNTGVHTSPLNPFEQGINTIREKKVFYGVIFVTHMTDFFKDRDYGKGVNEIFYREYCLRDGYNDKVLHYGPRRKIIDCAIVEDYLSVLSMNTEDYGKYLARLYIERSQQFSELLIKNFNLSQYLNDLATFFRNHSLIS